MTSDDRDTEPLRLGNIEFRDRSSGPGNGPARGGRGGNGSDGGGPDVRNGTIVPKDKAKNDQAAEAAPPVVDRSHIPPAVLENMRKQVGDFADFAHRSRIAPKSGDALLALGCGGGITAEVVEHMAAALFDMNAIAALGADQRTQTDSLLLSLVAPEDPDKLTQRQLQSFVSWRGRLALDVSAAPIEGEPTTTVVRLADDPARQLPAVAGPAGTATGNDLAGPCAALIVGSAAYIAGERPFLSLDALMTYARSKVYRLGGPAGAPPTLGAGLQAARNLEIVVLLDRWLEGGLWIDVNRANGSAAAALAIGLSPTGARFTHIPELRVPELRSPAADSATA